MFIILFGKHSRAYVYFYTIFQSMYIPDSRLSKPRYKSGPRLLHSFFECVQINKRKNKERPGNMAVLNKFLNGFLKCNKRAEKFRRKRSGHYEN